MPIGGGAEPSVGGHISSILCPLVCTGVYTYIVHACTMMCTRLYNNHPHDECSSTAYTMRGESYCWSEVIVVPLCANL